MLQLRDITVTVQEESGYEKTVLDRVSLDVPVNSVMVVTGPNGGGKSTLAKVIMGIETPASGKVLFEGRDVTHLGVTDRARLGMGFAFQQPVRFKGLTVLDMLSLASGGESRETACRCLALVGLCAQDYLDREVNATLSGGELKRLEIAMLIARDVRLSVFDEPEAGIDLWSFQNLVKIFTGIRAKRNATAIIISHQERIMEAADIIAVLSAGTITALGPRESIFPFLTADIPACGMAGGVR